MERDRFQKVVEEAAAQRGCFLADIDFNERTGLNDVFVHSLLVYGGNERKVYCEPDDSVFKVLLDGSVQENPEEFVRKR